MKIKIINPNTTLEMTESIRRMAESVCDSDTELLVVSPTIGPASIEGYVDEYMAAVGVVDEVIKGDKENCDAYIIACFGDPGLQAAREATDKPVLGIAESAMSVYFLLNSGSSLKASAAFLYFLTRALNRTSHSASFW